MTNKSAKRKTILVIEDERPLVAAIKAKLEKNGFGVMTARSVEQTFNADLEKNDLGVITARSIEQALNYLEDLERIDAVWLDHNLLGKENGLDFVKKLKANGRRWNKIPIFVISNTGTSEIVQSYIRLGITKYFVKAENRLDKIIADIRVFLAHP